MRKLACILLIIVMCFSMSACESKAKLEESIIEKADSMGLEVLSVSFVEFYYSQHKFHYVNLTCTNFSDFSPTEMLDLANGIDNILPSLYLVHQVYQGSDIYEINLSVNEVELNGEEIYYGGLEKTPSYSSPSYSSELPISGQCTICKSDATDRFQGSLYCTQHYQEAIIWAMNNVSD